MNTEIEHADLKICNNCKWWKYSLIIADGFAGDCCFEPKAFGKLSHDFCRRFEANEKTGENRRASEQDELYG